MEADSSGISPPTPKMKTLRKGDVLSWGNSCLFCGEEIDEAKEKKKSKKYKRPSFKVGTTPFKDKILQMCKDQNDVRGRMVQKRLSNISHLVAKDTILNTGEKFVILIHGGFSETDLNLYK